MGFTFLIFCLNISLFTLNIFTFKFSKLLKIYRYNSKKKEATPASKLLIGKFFTMG